MQKLFNKILVPVDFSASAADATDKAFEIAKKYDCSIHFLNVVIISPFAAIPVAGPAAFMPSDFPGYTAGRKQKLEELCSRIISLSENKIHAGYNIICGTWNQGIIDFVNDNEIDLVLIGQKVSMLRKRSMILNPDLIAEKTNIPVITVPSNRRLTRLYSIVIPITDFLPVRKLMYGVYMALNFEATIKLLGIANESTKDKVQYYLFKAKKLILDNCEVRVECETVISENVADAVNHFAIHESADLVIVNPGTQTRMPGLLSSLFGNILQKYTVPPVLTVSPV
ncbi:MAG: universal stress protein [Bacteroidetes bacterium]|nr:universal stress protein [Bacteroidota bacterium]